MQPIRKVVSIIFDIPMQNMNYVSYLKYVNEGGKFTARSVMDILSSVLTFLEGQEKKNVQYEANFEEIEKVLTKLVGEKTALPVTDSSDNVQISNKEDTNICDFPGCGKSFSKTIALIGHKRSHKTQTVV